MTDRKQIKIQGALAGRYWDGVPFYSIISITTDISSNLGRCVEIAGDYVYFDTPEQIDKIIKALQEAKSWLK